MGCIRLSLFSLFESAPDPTEWLINGFGRGQQLRPPQETPDPDDDPTREWRNMRATKRASKRP